MSIRPSRTARLGRIALLLLCGWALGGGLAATLVVSHAALAASEAAPQKLWAYVGTYTGKSKGIYLCELDLGSGDLTLQGLAAKTTNPSFLAVDPAHRFLYAVNDATVSAFAFVSANHFSSGASKSSGIVLPLRLTQAVDCQLLSPPLRSSTN